MFNGNMFTNKLCSLVLGCYHVSNCLLAWINQQNYTHKPFSVLVAGRFSFVNKKEFCWSFVGLLCLLKIIMISMLLTRYWEFCEGLGLGWVKYQWTSVLCRRTHPHLIHSSKTSELQPCAVWLPLEQILFVSRAGCLVEKAFSTCSRKIE